MKTFSILFLMFSLVAIFAAEGAKPFTYIFPPFDKEDMASSVKAFPENPTYEEIKALSVPDLRSIMSFGNVSDQDQAAVELIERNDQKTILRLVYSLKQGNAVAEDLLRRNYSLSVLPYLIEDVAHGSIEQYEKCPPGGDVAIVGRVRSVAAEVVSRTLANSPEPAGATRDYLKAISFKSDSQIVSLSDKSRYLIEWWQLNERALNAGKWGDAQPLPQEIRHPSGDTTFPSMESQGAELDPARQSHILGPSWELPESFEAWSKRIVHPELRNLDFVELTWDGKRVIEHPPKSLDPKASAITRQDRESRRALNSKTAREATEETKGIPWLAWCAALVVVIGLMKLFMRPKSASNF